MSKQEVKKKEGRKPLFIDWDLTELATAIKAGMFDLMRKRMETITKSEYAKMAGVPVNVMDSITGYEKGQPVSLKAQDLEALMLFVIRLRKEMDETDTTSLFSLFEGFYPEPAPVEKPIKVKAKAKAKATSSKKKKAEKPSARIQVTKVED